MPREILDWQHSWFSVLYTDLEGCFHGFFYYYYCLFVWLGLDFFSIHYFLLSVGVSCKKKKNGRNRVLLDVILVFTRVFLDTSHSRNFLKVHVALQCSSLCYTWRAVLSFKINLSSLENLFLIYFFFSPFFVFHLSFPSANMRHNLNWHIVCHVDKCWIIPEFLQFWFMPGVNFSNNVPSCRCRTRKDTQCPEQSTY